MVGSLFGAVAFLAFLCLATHVLLGLYASSVAASVLFDATHEAALAPADANARDHALEGARADLTGLKNVRLEWQARPGQLGLHLIAERPSFLPPSLAAASRITTIDKTSWVRIEDVR